MAIINRERLQSHRNRTVKKNKTKQNKLICPSESLKKSFPSKNMLHCH